MSTNICKACGESLQDVANFVSCHGICKEYFHYKCAYKPEGHSKKHPKMKKNWQCEDCRLNRRSNSTETNDLNSNNDSDNAQVYDKGYAGNNLDSHSGSSQSTENKLDPLIQDSNVNVIFENYFNKLSLKLANVEEQLRTQTRNLTTFSQDINATKDTVIKLDQSLRINRIEIHGLARQHITTEIENTIVLVGELFGVNFSVNDIVKVDVLPAKRNLSEVIVVQFRTTSIRDMLIANRKKEIYNYNLPYCSDTSRIYINENLCPYFKYLWHEARIRAKNERYKFVWVKKGKLYVRKDASALKIRITSTEDLDKIK